MSARIITGDVLQALRTLESASIDAVVTDPPYSSGTRREASKGLRKAMTREVEDDDWFGTDSLTTNGFVWLMRECSIEWQRLLRPGGHVLCFIDWRMMPALSGAIESADLRSAGLLVWDKTFFGMGACFRNQHEFILHFTKGVGSPPRRRDVGNVLRFKPVRDGDHPTQKPLELMRTLISVIASPGETILDPFAGSGTTLLAARHHGCNAIGVERDRSFVEVSERRIADDIPLFEGNAA
jgi:DNA modification methylase